MDSTVGKKMPQLVPASTMTTSENPGRSCHVGIVEVSTKINTINGANISNMDKVTRLRNEQTQRNRNEPTLADIAAV